jgi:hypothetical protein
LFRECAQPKWLGTSHMLVLGTYWAQAYFEERPIVGKEYLILEHVQQVTRKKDAEKEGKATCKRKRNVVSRTEILTMIGLGFFIRIITAIIL